jgi:hypothetical protein
MNISSSISQVIFQTQLPGKILLKKAYLWPEYNAGKITKITPVHERTELALNYVKRSSVDSTKDEIINNLKNSTSYNSNGGVLTKTSNYTPGSIFEAFA